MSESTDDLRARVAALEAENATLRSSPPTEQVRPVRRSRAVIAVVMIVLGVLLAPVAVVSGWATWTLTDTARFVSTYAPLAENPQVREYVVDQTMTAIENQVDVDALTEQLIEGLIALGTGPRATTALHTLRGSIADGLRSQIRSGITTFVDSDQFATVWAESLRVGHTQLIATLRNDPQALATIAPDGTLGIPLGPIVERVKAELVARGLTVAERIPPINRNVVLVESDQLPKVQLAYGLVVGLGTWLPWVVIALLAGGVLVANRRHRALIWAAGGFGAAMVLLAISIAAGRIGLVAAVPASVLPGSVSTLFYDAATSSMRSTALAAAVLGAAVALVAWCAGPSRTPTRLRGLYGDGVAELRSAAENRGVTTGGVGAWVHRHRSLLFAAIAVVAALVLVFNTPISAGLVAWTAFWSVLAVIVVTLVERPAPTLLSDHDRAPVTGTNLP